MTKDEALKLALDFIENSECGTADLEAHIKEALAQPEQPKVRTGDCLLVGVCASEGHKIQPQRTWVGLTDEELQPIADEYRILFGSWVTDFARAIEAKLRSKNSG